MRLLSLGTGLVILGLAAAPIRLTAQEASGEALVQQKCAACRLPWKHRP